MEKLLEIEQAYTSDNHETVVSMLDSIDSIDLKKAAFLKIIEYYENKSLSPVGYMLLFTKWLAQNNDYKTTMEYVNKCREMGVAEARLSQLIYENVIKPHENFYRENYHKNLQLLQKHNILFSKQEFDFDQVKKQVLVIENVQPDIPDVLMEQFNRDKRPLLIDIINFEFINNVLGSVEYIYFVYDDLQLFYYMLLFEDFTGIYQYIRQKKVIFFVGEVKELLEDFFSNLLTIPPAFCFGLSVIEKYNRIINEIVKIRSEKHRFDIKELNGFYRDYDYKYYRELFAKGSSEIKIMLITSEKTELNKFIIRNWYEAFVEMGYQAKLLIENEPYECMSSLSVCDSMNEFKPDIVFHVNFTVGEIFKDDGATCRNILWISRYRDTTGSVLYHAEPGYEYNNMFILPLAFNRVKELIKIGIPENRILNTADGINSNVFTKKEKINKQYACDIVSVNNAVGSLSFRIDFHLKGISNDNFRKAVLEAVEKLKEKVNDEKNIFSVPDYTGIIDALKEKMAAYGLNLKDGFDNYILNLFGHVNDCLYRGKIMEWIVDSGITSNIKFWGKYWANIQKFKKYHMGVAGHGEELSDIYRSSKISLSDTVTFHERNFEIFTSGGFPLIIYVEIPEINKTDIITSYFKKNKEVVLFHSKDDLLNKIQYYLDNPEEREMIAENGRQVVLDNFSHMVIAGKTMEFIKKYYKSAVV